MKGESPGLLRCRQEPEMALTGCALSSRPQRLNMKCHQQQSLTHMLLVMSTVTVYSKLLTSMACKLDCRKHVHCFHLCLLYVASACCNNHTGVCILLLTIEWHTSSCTCILTHCLAHCITAELTLHMTWATLSCTALSS